MADPPIFVAEYESVVWNTSAHPKTASVTLSDGDLLLICGAAEADGLVISTPAGGEGGGTTYPAAETVVSTNYAAVYSWTCPSVSGQTYTLSVDTNNASLKWGFNAVRFTTTAGLGATAQTHVLSGAPSLNLTTTGDNSAVLCMIADFNAVDGASRTWRTVNGITPTAANSLELTYLRDAAAYTVYVGYWNDVGPAGTNAFGLSAPGAQKYSMVALEILGPGLAPPGGSGGQPTGTRRVTAKHHAASY